MKRILLIVLLVLGSYEGFSNSLVSLWAGAGLATRYNYDYGLSFGLDYTHALFYRVGIGLSAFAQQYNLYYDKDNANVVAGSMRNQSTYVFACPKLEYHLGKKGNIHFYLTGGAGFKMNATDTLRKWSKAAYSATPGYDSMIDRSASMNSLVYRLGFGFTEYFPTRGHLSFTLGQDFGFLPGLISTSDDPSNASLHNNVNQFYKPTYITFRLGICYNHSK